MQFFVILLLNALLFRTSKYYYWAVTFICSCIPFPFWYIDYIATQVFIYQVQHTSSLWVKKIRAASTAVPSLSNIMHIVLSINADLRPVPADITCRPDSLLTQTLQAYWGATGGHASLRSIYMLPILLSRHDNAFHFSTNNEIIMINQSTFTFLI